MKLFKLSKFFLIYIFLSDAVWVQEVNPTAAEAAEPVETTTPRRELSEAKKSSTTEAVAKPTETVIEVTPSATKPERLPDVVVTASREDENKRDLPIAIGGLNRVTIKNVKPIHPSEIMNRVPGVFMNTTSGEGHMMSIRQPLSTNPYYLYLEDGIPTRATGFFNHNALYEVNIPQAASVEVIKGPATALYGSDAVGGVVNVLTRRTTREREMDLSAEYGGFGFKRLMASVGEMKGANAVRVEANLTDSTGWRNGTQFARQAGLLRWDFEDGRDHVKTMVSAANITQQSAGVAQIAQSDYDNNRQANYMPISYRKVAAIRASSRWDHEFSKMSVFSTTLYGRYNEMSLLPNYLGFSPTGQNESNLRSASVGLMLKHDLKFSFYNSKLITGADFDYSPGAFKEWGLTGVTKTGNYLTSYSTGPLQYDYNAGYYQASPYAQFETSPFTDRLHVNLGLRYDHLGYVYSDYLKALPQNANLYRPGDAQPSYDHLSPKAGIVYDFAEAFNLWTSYRHGFRVAAQNDLFRAGKSTNSASLQPIKADSYEVGFRGTTLGERIKYEVTGYYMVKTDDLVTFINPDNSQTRLNAGGTLHRGVEIGLEAEILKKLVFFSGNFTYAEHKYTSYTSGAIVYDGNQMAVAPNMMSTLDLKVKPLVGLQIELEWVFLGKYYEDDLNTHQYAGHNYFNVRTKYAVNERFSVFARIHNLTNVRYSDYTTYNAATGLGPLYAPGEPLSLICGLSYSLQ